MFDLEDLTQSVLSRNDPRKWSKAMNQSNDAIMHPDGLKRTKGGQYSLSNFAFEEFEHPENDELTPEEEEYKEENDEMFGKKKAERNPNNPYLTKAERGIMDMDKSGEEITAGEEDEGIPEPNPYETVKLGCTEDGIVVSIGSTTGIIKNSEIGKLFDFVKSVAEYIDGNDDKEEEDEDDGCEEEDPPTNLVPVGIVTPM